MAPRRPRGGYESPIGLILSPSTHTLQPLMRNIFIVFKDRSKSRFDSGFVVYAKLRVVHNRDLVGTCFLPRVMAVWLNTEKGIRTEPKGDKRESERVIGRQLGANRVPKRRRWKPVGVKRLLKGSLNGSERGIKIQKNIDFWTIFSFSFDLPILKNRASEACSSK